MSKRPIPLEIETFFHCKKCLEEIPEGTTPREWNRSETGFTPHGIQVWCLRHNINIVHFRIERGSQPDTGKIVETKEGPE